MALKDRPTADLIVLFLTGVVAVVVVGTLTTAIILDLAGRGDAADDSIVWIARITNTIIGGIFGYLAGRSVDR